jgi:hypothetical protein
MAFQDITKIANVPAPSGNAVTFYVPPNSGDVFLHASGHAAIGSLGFHALELYLFNLATGLGFTVTSAGMTRTGDMSAYATARIYLEEGDWRFNASFVGADITRLEPFNCYARSAVGEKVDVLCWGQGDQYTIVSCEQGAIIEGVGLYRATGNGTDMSISVSELTGAVSDAAGWFATDATPQVTKSTKAFNIKPKLRYKISTQVTNHAGESDYSELRVHQIAP